MAERAPDFTQPTEPGAAARRRPGETRRRTAETETRVEREPVRREPTVRYEPMRAERVEERTDAQKAATVMGAASAAIGALGFVAPVVTGNDDRIINTHNGKLLGIFAINPPHALVHLGFGVAGLAAGRRSDEASRRYLEVSTGAYGALAAAGFVKGRDRKGIYEFMGMALNAADNWLHTVWAGAAAAFSARGERRAQRMEPEIRRRAA